MKNKIELQNAYFQHLMEETDLESEAFNPFIDFEKNFYRYSHVAEIQLWHWEQGISEPYAFIQSFGFYDNLNDLAQRVRNETYQAQKSNSNSEKAKRFKHEYDSLGSWDMQLSHPWEKHYYHLILSHKNQTDAGITTAQDIKFELCKEEK